MINPASRPFLTFTDLAEDDWAVLRDLLPGDADVPLLMAAHDAANRLLRRIIETERRPGLSEDTARVLDAARASAIGRIAQIDDWCRQLEGTSPVRHACGEDTAYARAMRVSPERLERVIAAVLWWQGTTAARRLPAGPRYP